MFLQEQRFTEIASFHITFSYHSLYLGKKWQELTFYSVFINDGNTDFFGLFSCDSPYIWDSFCWNTVLRIQWGHWDTQVALSLIAIIFLLYVRSICGLYGKNTKCMAPLNLCTYTHTSPYLSRSNIEENLYAMKSNMSENSVAIK